jgi:hypothetical protein
MHGFLSNLDSKVEKPTQEKHASDSDYVPDKIFFLKMFRLLSVFFGVSGKPVQVEEVRGEVDTSDEKSKGNSAEKEFFTKENGKSKIKEVRIYCFH